MEILQMNNHIEGLKIKMLKLRERKWRKNDKNHQICQNCQKHFTEKLNFNWSCRTHHGKWGGSVWWCCGKTTEEARGCRYAKHVKFVDEDDLAEQVLHEVDKHCQICRDPAHEADDCPCDPNIRTKHDPNLEVGRLKVVTKKKKTIDDANFQTYKMFERVLLKNQKNEDARKRLLSFDDFNYSLFNENIFAIEKLERLKEAPQGKAEII